MTDPAVVAQALGYAVLGGAALHALAGLGQALRRHARENRLRELELLDLRSEIHLRHALRRFRRKQSELSWEGVRKFRIDRKVQEGGDICSFYLTPHDRKPLPPFHPGQFLTFRFQVPDQPTPVVRCYSLSDAPREPQDAYRISVKRIPPPRSAPDAPPGLASGFLHDTVSEGDIIDVQAPAGEFFLDLSHESPVVLVGGGVGVTPVLSMLNAIVETGSRREVWFFYGVRNSREHVMREHLEQLDKAHPNVHLRVCYSAPIDQDLEGETHHVTGRVTIDLLRDQLPSNAYDFFICGPGPMMTALTEGLAAWDVPESRIHFEAFGPASVKPPAADGSQPAARVRFDRSAVDAEWTPSSGTLLELAQSVGVTIPYGCRVGDCGTCEKALKTGRAKPLRRGAFDVHEGSCLTCIAVPEGDVVIDA